MFRDLACWKECPTPQICFQEPWNSALKGLKLPKNVKRTISCIANRSQKITPNFMLYKSICKALRVMEVRAQSCECPLPKRKALFSVPMVMVRSFSTPGYGRKGCHARGSETLLETPSETPKPLRPVALNLSPTGEGGWKKNSLDKASILPTWARAQGYFRGAEKIREIQTCSLEP